MRIKLSKLIATLACGLFLGVHPTFAQTWMQTSAPLTNWTSIASSADGSKLIAVAAGNYPDYDGRIFVSRDSGFTWTNTGAPSTNWWSVASSADGARLVAVVNNGGIYVSPDSGTNWTLTGAPAESWSAVASSASGEKLVAVSSDGSIYTSINAGTTWERATNAPFNQWNAVASSADGSGLIAGGCWCGILAWGRNFISADSGVTWADTGVSSYSSSVASSAEGTNLIVVNGSHMVVTSTNSGATWTTTAITAALVASSADGATWVALNYDGTYISTNSGATWAQTNAPSLDWKAIASSADGKRLVAVAARGGIWTFQSTPTPGLSIARSNTNLVLSWIVPSMDFALQENVDLTTTNWTNVTNTPVLNSTDLRNQVNVLQPTSNRFYRLKHGFGW